MAPVGFSTGALAREKFRRGFELLGEHGCEAAEFSALRESELGALLVALRSPEYQRFRYRSIHAPSRLSELTEAGVAEALLPFAQDGWHIVLHPDVIREYPLWRPFRDRLCIENMDKRKTTGRTADELATVFDRLPEASMCFDIAHARQIDPTMFEAWRILAQHGPRIRQMHLSDLNSASRHEPLTWSACRAFRTVLHALPHGIAIILESPVDEQDIEREIRAARALLADWLIASDAGPATPSP